MSGMPDFENQHLCYVQGSTKIAHVLTPCTEVSVWTLHGMLLCME